jgi:hypothetical protein
VTIGDVRYTIRKLGWKTLERARDSASLHTLGELRAMGGDVLKALRSEAGDEARKIVGKQKEEAEAKRRARYIAFDRSVLLEVGLKSWSLPGEISAETINELPADHAEKLHEAIVDLSVPLPEEAERLEGNA